MNILTRAIVLAAAALLPAPVAAQGTFEFLYSRHDRFYTDYESMRILASKRVMNGLTDSQTVQNWCWAAVTATVLDILGEVDPDPCEVAAAMLNRRCCDAPNICNVQNTMEAMRPLFVGHGIKPTYYQGQLSLAAIISDLQQDRPVTIRVQSRLGQGHFINIVGFDIAQNLGDTRALLLIHDPMQGYFKGVPSSMGYMVDYNDLARGNLHVYKMTWTHSVRYSRL